MPYIFDPYVFIMENKNKIGLFWQDDLMLTFSFLFFIEYNHHDRCYQNDNQSFYFDWNNIQLDLCQAFDTMSSVTKKCWEQCHSVNWIKTSEVVHIAMAGLKDFVWGFTDLGLEGRLHRGTVAGRIWSGNWQIESGHGPSRITDPSHSKDERRRCFDKPRQTWQSLLCNTSKYLISTILFFLQLHEIMEGL